ncbi:Succinate dehydrogenase assembly factor 4, mitochondrial [Ananas comosus]|uniref:Succinate dehydrogenase assembly factor 4, mitochondrial n=1 Tax=Ananas comosus TaxID=4615 RepID=A0A199V1M8_ANACO|nr:Succinate dehydrogenase assembly factor 4, mitochondrial [Ananas comosus]
MANKLRRLLSPSLAMADRSFTSPSSPIRTSLSPSIARWRRSLSSSDHRQPLESSRAASSPPAKEEEEEYEYEEGNNTAEKKSEGEEGEEDDGVNKLTGEVGGPKGPEPTRYGDWERGGRCSDF